MLSINIQSNGTGSANNLRESNQANAVFIWTSLRWSTPLGALSSESSFAEWWSLSSNLL